MAPRKSQRRQQILEALAQMLEANPGNRITTAGLARQVGVSEAALYRHFPSKSKMFEGLIEFAEDSVFGLVRRVLADGPYLATTEFDVGRLVALADKIDTLVGLFAVGAKPTGSKDPFALRRAALGVIRLILDIGRAFHEGDIGTRVGITAARKVCPNWQVGPPPRHQLLRIRRGRT